MACFVLFIVVFAPIIIALLILQEHYGPDAGGALLPMFIGWCLLLFIGHRIYLRLKYGGPRESDSRPQAGAASIRRRGGNCPICGADPNEPHRGH